MRGKKNKSPCIVFTGGGTGGHIYPGLAVAAELAHELATLADNSTEKPLKIVWIGSVSGMDKTLIEKSGIVHAFYGIPAGKLRRYFSLKTVAAVFQIAAGFIASFCILLKIKPAAVFSKGGYVSVPPCFAAKCLSIPVYTHECDFSPGLATKLNGRAASRIFVSYAETAPFLGEKYRAKITVTGNPVRAEFYTANAERGRKFLGLANNEALPILLVLGGSLGARQINTLVQENLEWLCERFIVVHQCGKQNVPQGDGQENYKPYQFIYGEMADVVAAADIVLSRAGANSLWECAVSGLPLVLIPLAGSGTRGDQVENAAFFARKNAAIALDGNTADSAQLQAALSTMRVAEKRAQYKSALSALVGDARPARTIAEILSRELFTP